MIFFLQKLQSSYFSQRTCCCLACVLHIQVCTFNYLNNLSDLTQALRCWCIIIIVQLLHRQSKLQALKFVWVEGCYVKILHHQQLLDVLFKDRHCFVDGLWSLLAMSSSMLFFMHVDRAQNNNSNIMIMIIIMIIIILIIIIQHYLHENKQYHFTIIPLVKNLI